MRKIWTCLFPFLLLAAVCQAQLYVISPSSNGTAGPLLTASPLSTMYVSSCAVTVNTATATSTFCPNATDSTSIAKRTFPAGYLVIGKAFTLTGGGKYSVPAGNLNTADIVIKAGTGSLGITTPAAPVGTNQNVKFFAACRVSAANTLTCNGSFSFLVAGTGLSADAPIDGTITFDNSVSTLIDVTGDWNTSAGALTTQTTTVDVAYLSSLN